ncbi:MAG TPA: ABC transporter substrate-binding protein [Dehalococcoidia bacterium]|nr:ABC transporter substrate-binding protein [Dehalococcoidia bacterium]
MTRDYWSKVGKQRLSRRRALIVAGGAAAAGAFLVACGGSDESSGDKSDLVTQPVDTSKQAKRGGTNKWYLNADPAGFDVHVGGVPKNNPKNLVYSNLVSAKPGYMKAPDFSEYIPDIAQSWEWSPDGMQLMVKIQPNAKWHDKPPINGRAFDIEDLIFSWNRFAAKGRDRGAVANASNPNAPVLSFTATDARTAVIKLKEPTVYLLALFAPTTVGKPVIIPKETDSTFNLEKDMIGTGPYVLTSYTPSVGMSFKKFPDYYEKDFAFFEQIEAPFVVEYAQALAQLKAGNIYAYATGTSRVRQDDVLALKKDVPQLQLYGNQPSGFSGAALNFGWLPAGQSPFKDERVRQALSMSWDRDLYIDVFSNGDKFKAAGLPVQTYWASALSAGTGSWRLDPKSKDFGPNAKYFQHNPDEAKKLLAAAGYADGLEVISSYIPGQELGDSYQKENQVLEDMARQVGFKPKANLVDYVTKYPGYRDSNGKYEGWAYIAGPTTADDAVGMLVWRYNKAGGAGYLGFDVAGKGDGSGDPQVDTMLKKAQGEQDTERRKATIFELQRYLAQKQYNIPKPGEASYFTLAWPALRNFGVYKGDRRTENYYQWVDETQAPIKKA